MFSEDYSECVPTGGPCAEATDAHLRPPSQQETSPKRQKTSDRVVLSPLTNNNSLELLQSTPNGFSQLLHSSEKPSKSSTNVVKKMVLPIDP